MVFVLAIKSRNVNNSPSVTLHFFSFVCLLFLASEINFEHARPSLFSPLTSCCALETEVCSFSDRSVDALIRGSSALLFAEPVVRAGQDVGGYSDEEAVQGLPKVNPSD